MKICGGVRELDLLTSLICPTMLGNAHSTCVPRVTSGRPMKLAPKQRLLNFILCLKYDNIVAYESFQ